MSGGEGHCARLRLIGAFRLLTPAGDVVAVNNRRARGLLAFLSLQPDRSASRERVRGLLWSDRAEPQARSSLRQCLLDLRDILGRAQLDILEVGREHVALKEDAVASDVGDLERALADGKPDDLIKALNLIGSAPFLEGLDLPGLFYEWLEQTRTRLEQSIAAGVVGSISRLEAAGDWSKVSALAEAYLLRDPLDEAVVAAAIRADAALGNASGARRRFQILEAALAKEFGVPPGAAARDALATIPAQPATKPTPREQPPAPPASPIVGVPPLVVVATFEAGGEDSRLAAALREEVISGLSRFRDMRIITDPRSLEAVASDPSAEQANAYALGASLRGDPAHQRLIVQLLRSGQRQVIWSGRFDMPGSHIVGTIDDIIAKVVGAVLPTINSDLIWRPGALSDSAFERYLLLRRGPESNDDRTFNTHEEARAAAAALEAMVTENPASPLPYLPLAFLYNTDFGHTRAWSSGPKEQARALHLAKTALVLDRADEHAYTATGWCYLRARQWGLARTHLDQALALNPFHARRVMEVGFGLLFLGDIDAARAMLDRCLLLHPSPDDGFFMDLGLLSLVRGEHDLAGSYFDLMAYPSVWSVIYSAINAELGGLKVTEQREEAVRRMAAIWPDDRAMTSDSVAAWIASHHPFHDPQAEDRFLSGARRAFREVGRPE